MKNKNNLFSRIECSHSTRQNYKLYFALYRAKKAKGQKPTWYRAPLILIILDEDIKRTKTLEYFVSQIKKFEIENRTALINLL